MLNMPDIRTDEEAYKFVMQKLLEQNERSTEEGGDCQYRGYKSETILDLRTKAGMLYNEDEEDNTEFHEELLKLLAATPYNAKCAAGFLIDDNVYSYHLEGQTVQYENTVHEYIQKSNPLWNMNENSVAMVERLQQIHDSDSIDDWESSLEKVGYMFNTLGAFVPFVSGECS